ncbi:unnamed protein product [Polarella glacialis]|uniref:LAGLIDADG endonuclease n=1 Tax=Polarella glacialis TaxID=89957 RepID=A0A813HMA9_POLGL|nr:unnamed protein product [Polarella glacialis]
MPLSHARTPWCFGARKLCSAASLLLPQQHRSLESWERRICRLSGLLHRLEWPKLSHFTAFGERYELPVRAASILPGVADTTLQDIQYLAGFFDGDGCVSPSSKNAGCSLIVGQVSHNSEVLVLYRRAFGGGIYGKTPQRGLSKSVLHWVASGPAGKRAAAILGQHACAKHHELFIASEWPRCALQRSSAKATLSSMKREDVKAREPMSWPYFAAGFFDADGCIRIPPRSSSIILEVSQKRKAVLVKLQLFLEAECPGHASYIYTTGCAHVLSVHTSMTCRMILAKLLAAGLLGKRAQAELALGLTSSNRMETRAALANLKGNQSRYRILDEAGCARAADIQSVQKVRLRLLASGAVAAADEQQVLLTHLKQQHTLEKAATWHSSLRCDIRSWLMEGAFVVARDAQNKLRVHGYQHAARSAHHKTCIKYLWAL